MKKLVLIFTTASLLLPLFVSAQDASATAADAGTGATDTSGASASAPTPSGAAYQFKRQGIFDCNQNGSYAMSVGALSAIGGAYVPVADAAVELNTGTLVYKECVLREVVDRESESAGTALTKQMTVTVLTGRNGNAFFVVQPESEMVLNASDPKVLAILQGNTLQKINPAFQSDVKRAIAQIYEAETRAPQNILTCPIKNDVTALESGVLGTFNWQDFSNLGNPACYTLGVTNLAQSLTSARVGEAYGNLSQQWLYGRGFYPRTDANGNIVTPAATLQSSYQTQLDSAVHRLENANDIGQMIGALYAGINTQIVADSQGLSGLTQSIGGQPSYLDQVAKESAQGLQGAAVNAALQILGATQQVETAYFQAVNAIGASLTQTKQQIQAAEAQCWTALIPKVCTTPLKPDNTCIGPLPGPCTTDPTTGVESCPTPPTLQVATSTAFSSAIIDAQIGPLIPPAIANIQASQTALQLISNLIQGITNTDSLDAQRVALSQLDTLVVQHKLHTQTDLTTVVQQQSAVANSMGNLLQKTAQTWGGGGVDGGGNVAWDGTTNPGQGWCNLNNSATIQSWIQTWTKK